MVIIMLFIALVFLIFGFIFLIYEMIKEKKRKNRCTESVLAEVISYTGVRFYDNEDHSYYTKKAPLYEYSYKGELCRMAGSTDSKWVKKMKVGSQIELFVDPDNPKSFYCPEEIRFVRKHGIIIACVVVTILVLIIGGIEMFAWYARKSYVPEYPVVTYD